MGEIQLLHRGNNSHHQYLDTLDVAVEPCRPEVDQVDHLFQR